MLGDLDGAQVGCATMVTGNFSVVVEQLLEVVVEGVG
jgi:hypothetical protein